MPTKCPYMPDFSVQQRGTPCDVTRSIPYTNQANATNAHRMYNTRTRCANDDDHEWLLLLIMMIIMIALQAILWWCASLVANVNCQQACGIMILTGRRRSLHQHHRKSNHHRHIIYATVCVDITTTALNKTQQNTYRLHTTTTLPVRHACDVGAPSSSLASYG